LPPLLTIKSEIGIKFEVEALSVMTIHKAEGYTMPNAILDLSKPPVCSLTYCHIYVAFSCVCGCDIIHLLLNSEYEYQKWDSLSYIDHLRANKYLDAFFAGYDRQSQSQNQ